MPSLKEFFAKLMRRQPRLRPSPTLTPKPSPIEPDVIDYYVQLEIELFRESEDRWLAYVRNWQLLGEGTTPDEAISRAWKLVAHFGARYLLLQKEEA